MPITECGHGHLYDTDKYVACPYCNKTSAPGMGSPLAAARPTTQPSQMNGGMAFNQPRSIMNSSSTVAPESYRRKLEDEQKTCGKYEKEMGIEPVAGWLVCIKGEEKGKSYPLVCRINFIGRSESMDVCLKKDLTITKSNHAQVSYEPRYRKFYLIRGESKNNIYLNDAPVYMPTEINAYDVLGFGETDLVFVPFCGPNFSWETGLSKE